MRYFLHTSNDLIFEFDHGEMVTLKGRIENDRFISSLIGGFYIQNLESHTYPFTAIINDEEYSITSFRKIQQ